MHRDILYAYVYVFMQPYFAHLAMKVYLVFSFFSLFAFYGRVWSLAKLPPLPAVRLCH